MRSLQTLSDELDVRPVQTTEWKQQHQKKNNKNELFIVVEPISMRFNIWAKMIALGIIWIQLCIRFKSPSSAVAVEAAATATSFIHFSFMLCLFFVYCGFRSTSSAISFHLVTAFFLGFSFLLAFFRRWRVMNQRERIFFSLSNYKCFEIRLPSRKIFVLFSILLSFFLAVSPDWFGRENRQWKKKYRRS